MTHINAFEAADKNLVVESYEPEPNYNIAGIIVRIGNGHSMGGNPRRPT